MYVNYVNIKLANAVRMNTLIYIPHDSKNYIHERETV